MSFKFIFYFFKKTLDICMTIRYNTYCSEEHNKCECAGIGRQARLRGVCFTTYGFKSHHSHQREILTRWCQDFCFILFIFKFLVLSLQLNRFILIFYFCLKLPVSPAGLVDTSAEGARRKCPWGTEAPTEPGGETGAPHRVWGGAPIRFLLK